MSHIFSDFFVTSPQKLGPNNVTNAPQIAVHVHGLPGSYHGAVLPNAQFPEALARARLGRSTL